MIPVKNMVGYGLDYQWDMFAPAGWTCYRDYLGSMGMTMTGVELFSYDERKLHYNADATLDKFVQFARIMIAGKMHIKLTICNWNVGQTKGIKSYCDGMFSDEWYGHVLSRIINEIPGAFDYILLEPCSEFGPSQRNKNCWKKAERWTRWSDIPWAGTLSWNYESRPKPDTVPAGWALDFHTFKSSDCGPRGCLCVTDTGNVLAELCGSKWGSGALAGNLKALSALVRKCKAAGNGFLFYHFKSPIDKVWKCPIIDGAAIQTIRDAWRG